MRVVGSCKRCGRCCERFGIVGTPCIYLTPEKLCAIRLGKDAPASHVRLYETHCTTWPFLGRGLNDVTVKMLVARGVLDGCGYHLEDD